MTREQLAAALRKADAAGNTDDARRLAGAIRSLDAVPQPMAQQPNPMVAMGQRAQQEYAQAGSPALPPSATIAPAPSQDPLMPRGGWTPEQQAQQQTRNSDPNDPFNPANANKPAPKAAPVQPQNWNDQIAGWISENLTPIAEKAGSSVGGMIGGQRQGAEAVADIGKGVGGGLSEWGATAFRDPVDAANQAIETLDPAHQFAYAYNDANDATKAAATGDWDQVGKELKDLSTSGSFAAMSFLPGNMVYKGIQQATGKAAPSVASQIFKPGPTATDRAADILIKKMKADGLTLEDLQKVQRSLANRYDSGVYETFSELGGLSDKSSGANLRGLAMALGSVPGPAQEAILARVAENAEQLPKRTSRAASRATGQDASKAVDTLKALDERLKTEAGPLYETFYGSPVNEQTFANEILPILNTREGQVAARQARRAIVGKEGRLQSRIAGGKATDAEVRELQFARDGIKTLDAYLADPVRGSAIPSPYALNRIKRAYDNQISAAGMGSEIAKDIGGTKRDFAEAVSNATGGTYGEALGFYEGMSRLDEAFNFGTQALGKKTWQLKQEMDAGLKGRAWSKGEIEAIAMGVARNIEDLIEANDHRALTTLLKGKALKNLATALNDPKAAKLFEQSIQRLGANREWGRRVSGGSDTAMRQAAIDDASRLEEDPVTRTLERAKTATAPPSLFGAAYSAIAKPVAEAAQDAYRRLKYPGIRDEEVNAALAPMMGNAMSRGNLDEIAAAIEARLARKNPKLLPPPPGGGAAALNGPKGSPVLPPPAASPPARPPAKAGFGGGSKPLDMSEAARMPKQGYESIRIGPATVEITRAGDQATINRLKVSEGERGKGAASRALDEVLRQADAEGVTLFLTPERIGDTGLSDAQLKAFYTRHGFVSNRGPDRDFSTTATMVRKPRSSQSYRLDMSEPARMQRAREQGFDVETPLYHGTTHDFDEFGGNPNIESHHGGGAYFSTSPDDVARNYATDGGPDLTNRIERRAEQIQQELENAVSDGVDRATLKKYGVTERQVTDRTESGLPKVERLARDLAKKEIAGSHGGASIPVYARVKNPVITNGGTNPSGLRSQQARATPNAKPTRWDFETTWDDAGEEVISEGGPAADLVASVERQLSDIGADPDNIVSKLWDEIANNEGIDADAFERIMRQEAGDVIDYESSPGQIIQQAYRDLGHDGVILKNAEREFKNMNMAEGTDHYVVFDPANIRGKFAKFDPSQSGSSKLLSGLGASPEALGAAAGGVTGYIANPTDANDDGVIDDQDRGLNAMGGLVSGGLGVKGARMGGGVIGNALKRSTAPRALEPLELSKANRVYAPGKPDDLGFITSAEYVLGNPPARFRDAKNLSADQWRKFMREGGASAESFQWQIEPALKRLADEGITGDIPKAKLEEALARTRGTLDRVGKKTLGEDGFAANYSQIRRTHDAARRSFGGQRERLLERAREQERRFETDYGDYVAPGSHTGYKQHVLTLPPEQGQGYKSHNWQTENPVGHVRTTNRTSANGEKVLHVEELQSDLHQEGAKYGYKGEESHLAKQKAEAAYNVATDRYDAWARKTFGEPVRLNPGEIDDPVGKELARERQFALEAWKSMGRAGISPPRAPLENWEEPFIRYALKQGADQGVDVITFPTWDTLHKALQNEGTQKFYDQRMPRHLESVAKSLGLKVERVDMPIAPVMSGHFSAQPVGGQFGVVNDKIGEWHFSAGRFDTLEDAEQAARKMNKRIHSMPAIRLTPEAKQRLSEGIIMDAKDPGRRAPARRMPPVQAGFGGGPPKVKGARMGADRKRVRQGPRKVTLSEAETAARAEVTRARRAEAAQRSKYVMRDNRDEYLAPFEKATQDAEAKLAAVQAKERNARVTRVERRTMVRTALKHPIAIGLGAGAVGNAAVVAMSKFAPQKDYDAPPDPRRPGAFWEDVATKDKATVSEIQGALHEWGNWPTEKRTLPNGQEIEERVPQTGTYGKVTKAAVRRWRYDRGLDPDAPMTRSDLERLLAGPRGYQDDEGHWRYARDGERPRIP